MPEYHRTGLYSHHQHVHSEVCIVFGGHQRPSLGELFPRLVPVPLADFRLGIRRSLLVIPPSCRQSKDAEGSVPVHISLLLGVVNTFNREKVVAIWASLVISMFDERCLEAHLQR